MSHRYPGQYGHSEVIDYIEGAVIVSARISAPQTFQRKYETRNWKYGNRLFVFEVMDSFDKITDDGDGEDPGYIFHFASAATVHRCMNTRLLSNIHPPLARGIRISICMKVNSLFYVDVAR